MAHRILLVDDYAESVYSMARLLEFAGHEVFVAADGEAGLDRALDVQPDIAVIDLGLPRMNGYALARRVREHPDLRRTVLVCLTGRTSPEDEKRARAAGFDHFLPKPVRVETVVKLLDSIAHDIRSE